MFLELQLAYPFTAAMTSVSLLFGCCIYPARYQDTRVMRHQRILPFFTQRRNSVMPKGLFSAIRANISFDFEIIIVQRFKTKTSAGYDDIPVDANMKFTSYHTSLGR